MIKQKNKTMYPSAVSFSSPPHPPPGITVRIGPSVPVDRPPPVAKPIHAECSYISTYLLLRRLLNCVQLLSGVITLVEN